MAEEFKEHWVGEGENQRVVTPTAVLLALAQDQLAGWLGIGIGFLRPSDFSVAHFGIDVPGCDRGSQFDRPPPILDFDHHMVTTIEHPVDIFILAATAIHAQDRAAALAFIEIQGFFCSENEFSQASI